MSGAIAPLMIMQAGGQFISSVQQAGAARMKADYDKSVADSNAKLADYQAEDAIQRGDKESSKLNKAVSGLVGNQRANFAAQGIDVGTGSASEVQRDTKFLGALDYLKIKTNAAREAFGYKVQAANYTSAGQFAYAAGQNEANNTILTGGLSALGSGIMAGRYAYRNADNGKDNSTAEKNNSTARKNK